MPVSEVTSADVLEILAPIWMNRSQSLWERVAGLRSLPKNFRNIFVAARSYVRDPLPFVGVTSSP